MRISVQSGDDGYATFVAGDYHTTKYIVTLDGEPYPGCVMADEELGVLSQYLHTAEGHLYVDPQDGGAHLVYRTGTVKITATPRK